MSSFAKLHILALLLGLLVYLIDATPVRPATQTHAPETQCQRRKGLPPSSVFKKTSKATSHGAHVAPAIKGSTGSRKLTRREDSGHPSPGSKITLYHGSQEDFVDIDFKFASGSGDLHFGKKGFYLTDKLNHAAQYACLSYCLVQDGIPDATVIEYTWDGTTKFHEFTSLDDPKFKGYSDWILKDGIPANAEFGAILDKDMISGPMHTEGNNINNITPNFWQYVVLNEAMAKSHLHRVKAHKIPCSTVPAGKLP